ncbi:unnamed protein product, partial [Linum tenue]
ARVYSVAADSENRALIRNSPPPVTGDAIVDRAAGEFDDRRAVVGASQLCPFCRLLVRNSTVPIRCLRFMYGVENL